MPLGHLKRRELIALLGGAAGWPLAARAQQSERTRRVGVLMSTRADDVEGQARIAAFVKGLQQSGWAIPGNVQIEIRWSGGDPDSIRKYAVELVALAPDVILASGGAVVGPLLQATHTAALASEASGQRGDSKMRAPSASEDARERAGATRPEPGSSARAVPIVFTLTPDPVGAGFVQSLARPGGNATGFTSIEYEMSGKWLELLREIAPRVTRVAVLRDPTVPAGIGQFAVLQSVAPSLAIELSAISGRDASEIEGAVMEFARSPNGGLIVLGSALTVLHRELIIALAARHALPAVYPGSYFVSAGGLPLLLRRLDGAAPARGRLRRSHPQGPEAGQPSSAEPDQVRAGDQSQDRQDARPADPRPAVRARRPGGRISAFSRLGLSATCRSVTLSPGPDEGTPMDDNLPDLGDLERDVMQLVWAEGPITAETVRERLERKLKESTVRTVLRRLEEKGYVTHTVDGRTYVYQAKEERGLVAAKAVQRIVDWFCNGSVDEVLVGMVDTAMLDRKRLRMLTDRIAQTKGKR